MKIEVNCGKGAGNYHGTQAKGETWNMETVHGWKLACVDLLGPIKEREANNPEGGKTRALWYKRFILYFPSSYWWYFDLAVVKKWQ